MSKINRILSIILVLSLGIFTLIPSALAEENSNKLSLGQAIKMALERNRDLKIQELNVDKATEQLDDLRDKVKYIPDGVYIPGVSSAYGSYLQSEVNKTIAEKTYDNMRQQLVVDTKNQYYDVLKNINQVELAKKTLALAEENNIQAHTKYELGLITGADLYSFETNVSNAKAALTAAQNALQTSYTKLNQLIGRNDPTNPELVDDVVYEKSDLISLEAAKAQALSNRYEVWSAEHVADVTNRIKDYVDNYNVGDIDAKIKQIDSGKVKDQMEQQVETLYLSIQNMDQNRKALENKVEMLKEKLRVLEVQYSVGMATKLQVREAEQSYQSALTDLKQSNYLHDVAISQLKVLTGEDILASYNIK